MKIRTIIAPMIVVILLSACSGPIIIPADMAVTLPPNQEFILHATVPPAPETTSETPAPSSTATQEPLATITPTQKPTNAPTATRKAPYPVEPGSALIDIGFKTISLENTALLKPVFSALRASARHFTISADGQKLFLSTSNGTVLFNRQGEKLANWQNIYTADISCTSCLSSNQDGSRLAVITRNAGTWEAQIYTIEGDQASLLLGLALEPIYKGRRNEASIALSPDNRFLAIQVGTSPLRVLDLETSLQVFDFNRPFNSISFTRDGARFMINTGQELIFYKVDDWNSRENLLLPRENTPYALSPDGQLVVIAMPSLLRVYQLDKIREYQEINIPPSNASTRQWQIAFHEQDNNLVSGIALRWDANHTTATVETALWNLETRETLHFETSSSNSPDATSALWGSTLSLTAKESELETGVLPYNAFRFISDGMLLVNSPHSACWLKLFTGESNCFKDVENTLFASDSNTFKETRDETNTRLIELRSQKVVITLGPYPISAINRNGEWALINNGTGTDLYTQGKTFLQESVKGSLQGFAENANRIVFTALENENTFTITVVDKATGNAIIQKTDNFLYKPVVMTTDGTIYYTQNELSHNQTVFNRIDPNTLQINEVTRLSLPAEPRSLILSSAGLFAAGLKDGSVLIMNQNFGEQAIFQAATSSVENLAWSPDGRFLAVASLEGVQIFAIFPDMQ